MPLSLDAGLEFPLACAEMQRRKMSVFAVLQPAVLIALQASRCQTGVVGYA